MSEAFPKARAARYAKVVQQGAGVEVHVTIAFGPSAVASAAAWAEKLRYSYARDGELGAMLIAALETGLLDDADVDTEFDEQTDVTIRP